MIQLKNIVKTYAGDVHALRGIDLTIERGSIYGIIGLSGAGKSTLIRCINMLERPTSGAVLVDGRDLMRVSESELREERRHIGMIFQHFNLLSSATVYDNVAFPLRLAGKSAEELRPKVTELLTLVGLGDKANAYPSHLSGGQKQRVGIIAEEGDVVDVFTAPQQPITKEFISVLLSNELPTAFRGNPIEKTPSEGSYMLLRLTFLGERADDPVLAEMIRRFPTIEVTMLFGTLDQIKELPFGRMIIGMRGAPEEIQRAIDYLSEQHLKQEVIGYVRRNDAPAD